MGCTPDEKTVKNLIGGYLKKTNGQIASQLIEEMAKKGVMEEEPDVLVSMFENMFQSDGQYVEFSEQLERGISF